MKLISNIIAINKEAEKDAKETITAELNLTDHYIKKGIIYNNQISFI